MHLASRPARLRPACRRASICLLSCRSFTSAIPRCDSNKGQWHGSRPQRHGESSRKPWTRSIPNHSSTSEPLPQSHSLFRTLFPDLNTTNPTGVNDQKLHQAESRQRPYTGFARRAERREDSVASRTGDLWRDDDVLSTNELRSWLEAQARDEDVLPDREQMPAMLVLTNASRSLTESDFHRVGPQGDHLQGWFGPIKQIIQAYDRNTLEPLGSFFVLFTTKAAARAYQTQSERMHWPRRPLDSIRLPSHSPPSNATALSLSAFTLSSTSTAPLGLKLYSLPPSTNARLKEFAIDGILASAEAQTGAGSEQASALSEPKTYHRVILTLDSGAIDLSTLQGFLQRDSEYRNLPWDITHVYPYLPRKLRAAAGRMGTQSGSRKQFKTRAPQKNEVVEIATPAQEARGRDSVLGPAKSGRFILSFGDVHEARRFVRMWHRRVFQLPTSLIEAQAQEIEGQHAQSITLNAMIPW